MDGAIWSDHTDIQPTMMALLGLKDDYTPDGVVMGDVIKSAALPPAMLSNYPTLNKLGRVYTQLEAAVGEFGLATLTASTRALASNSPGDSGVQRIENQLAALGAARNALVARMQALADRRRVRWQTDQRQDRQVADLPGQRPADAGRDPGPRVIRARGAGPAGRGARGAGGAGRGRTGMCAGPVAHHQAQTLHQPPLSHIDIIPA